MYIIFINKFLLLKLASPKKPAACRGWRLFLQGFKGFNRLVVVLDGVDFLPSPLDGDALDGGAEIGHFLEQVGQVGLFEGRRPLVRGYHHENARVTRFVSNVEEIACAVASNAIH